MPQIKETIQRVKEKPDSAEYGKLRAYLARKGVKQADINDRVPVGGQDSLTRAGIIERMKTMCRNFPKAQ